MGKLTGSRKSKSILLFAFSFLGLLVQSQPLQGTYFIGSQASDYPTFSSAVAALTTKGISGNVTFKVRDGNYPEQISIPAISGSSCVTTVTFESAAGDSTKVVLTAPSAANNYVVQLDGATGVVFRKMTLRSAYGKVVDILGGASCNQFANNLISGVKTASSESASVIYGNQGSLADNNNVFRNNRIENGSWGVLLYGVGSSTVEKGTVIENNQFVDQYYSGITVYYSDSLRIAGNSITTSNIYYDFYGIDIDACRNGFQVVNNKLNLAAGGYGIRCSSVTKAGTSQGLVANNFIQIGGSSQAYGLNISYSTYIKVYHNSIRVENTSSVSGFCFYLYSSNNLDIRNNIFANAGGGYAAYISTTSAVPQSDYNDYFTTGATLGYWNGNRADLAAWQKALKKDSNSLSVNPLFKSPTDLHVSQIDLNGKATPLPEVTDDIDGDARNATTPDIGADEFIPPAADAGITQLAAPTTPFLHGNQKVKVILKNYGSQALTSAAIHWLVNGQEQVSYNYNGAPLASGATAAVEIGTYNFGLSTAYSLTLWTTAPNGVADVQTGNDTAEASGLYAAMQGTYTIGGASPTFPTFVAAVDALNKGGAIGPVTFRVRQGSYQGQVAITSFPGNSCNNPVTFEAESTDSTSVELIGTGASSGNNYAVFLNGADGITFKNITIRASYGVAVRLANGSDCNQFVGNRLIGTKTSYGSSDYNVVYSPGDQVPDNYNVFKNNRIEDGSMGIYLSGSYGSYANRLVIENNTLVNQSYTGINVSYNDSVRITGNEVTIGSSNGEAYGIYLTVIRKGFEIVGNKINLGQGVCGIWLQNADGVNTNNGLLANNFVRVNSTAEDYGIYVYGTDYVRIFHNNVSVSTTGAGSESYGIYYYSSSNLDVRNNIFANVGGGFAAYVRTPSAITKSDYNDYFTTGATLGYWNGNRADLAAWKTASKKDSNSLSVNPLFKSPTDLHVSQIDLNGKATPLPQVTDDIDGEPRDASTPDIGADEFAPLALDAGVMQLAAPTMPFLHGNQAVKATLKNYGSQSLTSATIHWQVNGQEQTPYNYTGGALAPGGTAVVGIGSYDFKLGTAYNVKLWTTAPNGAADVQTGNDTAETSGLYAAMQGTYTIGGASPTFTSFVTAVEALNKGGVVGPVTFKVRQGSYQGQIAITSFPGNSCNNPVTFEAESTDSTSVELIGTGASSGNNYAVSLNGADGVAFKKITIKAAYGIAVLLDNGADCNQFLHCRLVGTTSSIYADYGAVVYSSGQFPNNGNSFANNRIEDGSIGMLFYAPANKHATGLLIEGNTFRGQYTGGLNMNYQDSLLILANDIASEEEGSTGFYGVILDNVANGFRIAKNKIILAEAAYGIRLYSAGGTATNKGIIVNNFIKVAGTSYTYGIHHNFTEYVQVLHNTVSVSVSGYGVGYGVYYYGASNLEVKNNIFSNLSGGYVIYADYGPTSWQSDYNDYFTTGATLAYWNANYADLAAWQKALKTDSNSLSVNPLFKSPTDLHVSQIDLNGKATPLLQVTDDIDGEPRDASTPDIGADEFNSTVRNLVLDSIVLPKTGCGLNNATVKLKLTNTGSSPETGFTVAHRLNDEAPVTENVGAFSIPAGQSAYYTFKAPAAFRKAGTYLFTAYVSMAGDQNPLDDTLKNIAIENIAPVQPVTLSLPANGAGDVPLYGFNFSWTADSSATAYDLFLWKSTDTVPATPWLSGLQVINYTYYYYPYLEYNTGYSWKIRARNSCSESFSDVSTFHTVGNADLKVDTVIVPSSAVAGQTIEIAWQVKNNGSGSTGTNSWTDRVFLSNDKIYDAYNQPNADRFLKDFSNPGPLNVGESYKQTQVVKLPLPPDIKAGDYYIVVVTNYGNGIDESSDSNNVGVSVIPVTVKTDPAPDLQVTQIVPPTNALSGETRTVSWTVKNTAKGTPTASTWTDRVYLTQEAVFNPSEALYYENVVHTGQLAPDSTYTQSINLGLPNGIEGTFYVHVFTDVYKEVAEYDVGGEDNNTWVSDSFNVFLRLPADLVVSNVSLPSSASAGQPVTLTWTSTNQGSSSTLVPYWYDKVYLSISPVYDANTLIPVGTRLHTGTLAAGDSTTETYNVVLPAAVATNYYVYIVADAFNDVKEYVEDNNTTRSNALLPVRIPDLTVKNISVPDQVRPGSTLTVKWTVLNNGAGTTNGATWSERIILSADSVYNPSSGNGYTYTYYGQTLAAGDSVVREQTINLPANLAGLFYVHVVTDVYNDVYEDQAENNNTGRSTLPVNIGDGYPDLTASDVVPPPTAAAGQSMEVQWKTTNNGPGSVVGKTWTDLIYISPTPGMSQAVYVGQKSTTATLPAGSSLLQRQTVTLPANKTGKYYVLIQADGNNAVAEDDKENNNTGVSLSTVDVTPGPSPDLQVKDVSTDAKAGLNTNLMVKYRVVNAGKGATPTTYWNDRLYLSPSSSWNEATAIALKTVSHNRILASNEADTVETLVTIPFNVSSGTWYIYVLADADKQIDESTDEENNQGRSNAIVIEGLQPPDLVVSRVTAPATAVSGSTITMQWQVENKGAKQALVYAWLDAVYLSDDAVFDPSHDRLLVQLIQVNPFTAQGVYTENPEVQLPQGLSGTYYLFAVADMDNYNNDANYGDNYNLPRNNNNPVPIVISMAPPVDLQVTDLLVGNGTTGQPLQVNYVVRNTKSGTTSADSWTDRIYLSTNSNGTDGELVGSFVRNGKLNADGSYAVTLSVAVPSDLPAGNYFLRVQTDVNDGVYEQAEDNNSAFKSIFLAKQPTADLTLSGLATSDSVVLGKKTKLAWKTANGSANNVSGYLREAFYLSADQVLDSADVLFKVVDRSVQLNPHSSVADSLTERVLRVTPGAYYLIGRTDVSDNIPETNEQNNVAVAEHKIKVSVLPLALNTAKQDTLVNEQELYYRFDVPSNLVGESLVITLNGDSLNGNNEVYLRHNLVPSRSQHDYSQETPFKGNQEVIVPSLEEGTYYLMVYGKTNRDTAQAVSLLASILPFAITGIDANKGGNTGLVTTKITGSKFEPDMQVRLLDGTGNNVIPASSLYYINPTLVYASFNLNGKTAGFYTVEVKNKAQQTDSLNHAFEITKGMGGAGLPGSLACSIVPEASGGELVVDNDAPGSVRPNRALSFLIRYQNTSNIDIPVPVRFLVSQKGAPIGLAVEELTQNKQELLLELKEKNGPPAVLRPGASGEIRIYTKSIAQLSFVLLE